MATVSGRWSEGTDHGSQSPLLDVRFDKDETCLTEVDVDRRRTVRGDGWEEVVFRQTDVGIFELLAVPGEEDSSGAGPVADPENVAFSQRGTVGLGCAGIVVALEPVRGEVADRVAVPAWSDIMSVNQSPV